jgi:hypothetical protein
MGERRKQYIIWDPKSGSLENCEVVWGMSVVYLRMGSGWNWLRIMFSGGFCYYQFWSFILLSVSCQKWRACKCSNLSPLSIGVPSLLVSWPICSMAQYVHVRWHLLHMPQLFCALQCYSQNKLHTEIWTRRLWPHITAFWCTYITALKGELRVHFFIVAVVCSVNGVLCCHRGVLLPGIHVLCPILCKVGHS